MHSASGTLEAAEPFEFGRSLDFLRGFGPMSGQQEVEEGSVTKAVMVDGQTVAFRVRERGGELLYELFSEDRLEGEVEGALAERVSFFLSLKDDVEAFYSIAREKDPRYYPVVERAWGLHQVKFASLLEIVCWALINQRIQRAVALRVKRSLTERYGGKIELDGKVYWAFPDAARLRAATGRELLETTRNQRIAQRLGSLVSSLGELDESFLRTAPYEKARERLERVKGVGEWSSQFILFRGLGRMERLQPINVRPLGEVIRGVYGRDKPLDEVNETYGSWAGYWSLYLWASTMAGFK
ncbi:MAG TPA: hypothetical protein VLX56_07040 [Nitrososphaerales archaeon]|nr:hypothetical protein [Nitrososphaerales archaeon]